jgi:hypothetical protein
VNVLNAVFSHIVSSCRIKFILDEKRHIPNIYSITLAPSGLGKDKAYGDIRCLTEGFEEIFKNENESQKCQAECDIEASALQQCENATQKAKFIKQESEKIRSLKFCITSGTSQGLFADCTCLQRSKFGALFVNIEELGLDLGYMSDMQKLFMNDLIKLYEGKLVQHTTKDYNDARDISGVGCTCLFYSDPSKLLKDDKTAKYFETLLDAGLARRSFIAYQEKKEIQMRKKIDRKSINEHCNNYIKPHMQLLIDSLYNRCKSNHTDFCFSEETEDLFFDFINESEELYNKGIGKKENSVYTTELLSRHWKARKLSVIFACINHPNESLVTTEDVEQAISVTKEYTKSLKLFLNTKSQSGLIELAAFFMQNEGESIMTKDIRQLKIVNENSFKRWFDDILEDLENYLYDADYNFETTQGRGNSRYFVCTKIAE